MRYTLLEFINKKTENKFSFLKLKEVVYDKNSKKCVIFLLYPQTKDISDAEKDLITKYVNDYLELECKTEVWINKSYLDVDLLERFIKKYFELSHKSIAENIKNATFEIVINGEEVEIKISTDEDAISYIDKAEIHKLLLDEFNENFCGYFKITFDKKENEEVSDDEAFLNERLAKLQRESELNSLLQPSRTRYPVTDRKVLIGKEINVNPQQIKDVKRAGTGVILAGAIKFINEKSYKSKRTKKNEEGEEVPIEKPFFKFVLQDKSGQISAVFFPTKEKYHKFTLLNEGDTILVKGDITEFNGKLDLSVNDISLCQIQTVEEIMVENNISIEDRPYKCTKPVPFTALKQTNMFDVKAEIPKMFMGRTFVIYDLETTGLDPLTSEIIEIGALKVVDGETTEAFTCLVKPKNAIPDVITKITNITNDMVAHAYPIESVILDFYKFTQGATLAGYNNIDFDSKFIAQAAKKVGISFNNDEKDVFIVAKQKLLGLKSYKLGKVAEFLGVELANAHRALNDVIATTEVFIKLYQNNT